MRSPRRGGEEAGRGKGGEDDENIILEDVINWVTAIWNFLRA
jgi:hypothetical protein